MNQETILELKQLEISLKKLISEIKKHDSKLESIKNNTRQIYEDFEYVRAKHLVCQQNHVMTNTMR